MNKTSLKIVTTLLSVIFVLSVFPNVRVNAATSGACGEKVTWTLDSDGLLTISGEGPMYDYNYFDSNNKSPFTNTNIAKVVIVSGVTSIGNSAFLNCGSLASITIPDSITSIGNHAFSGCGSLASITIPDSVTSIGSKAFFCCGSLKSVDIPKGTTSLDGTFDGCFSLESVTIPDSVTSIVYNAFAGCSSIASITIPDSVTSIGDCAFEGCSGLTSITIPDNVASIGIHAFEGCSGLTSIAIPDKVTSISKFAFEGCSGLTSITIPDSVTSIGEHAFYGCSSLTSITIPNNVVSIEPDAFSECTNLETVEIDKDLGDTITLSNFDNCPKLLGENSYYICCKVTFVNEGGTVLQSEKTIIGTPIYSGSTPVKPTDSQHYTFSGWNDGTTTYSPDSLPVLTADTVFTAQYTANKYTITFVNYDGTELSSAQYDYDTKAEDITVPTASRKADEQYTYTFNGWDKEIAEVTGDATYKAQYTSTTNKYTVVFKDYNGNVLSSTAYDYDTKAEDIKVPTPSRDADAQYTYTFTGWDKEIADVTVDVTYTAQYSSTVNKYTIKFVDEEGNVLQTGEVAYGTAPEYTGTPSKAETDTATYAFAGWTDGTTTYGAADNLPTVTGAVTYKAVFTETLKPIEAETTIVKPVETPIEVAQPAPITYTIGEVKGDGINSDIVIDVHRSEDDANCISYFRSVANNGVAMKNGEQYTAVTGSTIITIKSDYIKTLPAGEYTITVNFKDGSISTTITIPERSGTSVPSTGESIGPAVYVGVALILVSCAATGFILTKKRREEA